MQQTPLTSKSRSRQLAGQQLRAEVTKARQERDNKKVQFKTHPPSLDDCPTYVIYKRKLKVWKSATCLEDRQQAALIMPCGRLCTSPTTHGL